jgi:hypothetical protein
MKRRTTDCYVNRPYERTPKGLCYRIFYDQCYSSKSRGHIPPLYTKEELTKWLISQPNFEALYNDWVDSNFTSDFRPSCDRLDNSKGYSFSNIELVTWKVNKERANRDVKNNIINTTQTTVYQYLASGKFVAKHLSIAEACRKDSTLDQRNITSCCQGKIPTAYGYVWLYTDEGPSIPPLIVNESYLCEIFQYDPITGDIVEVYSSIVEIPEPEFEQMKVRSVIRGDYYTHNGFFWSKSYLSPEEVIVTVNTKYLPKPILQLSLEGEVINLFTSMSEASQATNIRSGNISKVCNGKAKTAGGFIWKYY